MQPIMALDTPKLATKFPGSLPGDYVLCVTVMTLLTVLWRLLSSTLHSQSHFDRHSQLHDEMSSSVCTALPVPCPLQGISTTIP